MGSSSAQIDKVNLKGVSFRQWPVAAKSISLGVRQFLTLTQTSFICDFELISKMYVYILLSLAIDMKILFIT